jgi:ribonuclease BN (tRNA processing enzyme)
MLLTILFALAAQRTDTTTVVLLGTGMPRPNPAASGPATAVVVGSRVFLFDAGPGVERQLAAAHLPITGPTATFITHLHSDHTLGLPDLLLTSWVMGRQQPLPIYGPKGLAAMMNHILAAWSEDIAIRTHGLEHESAGGERADVHEIHAGVVYDSAGVKITAIPVLHGTWPEAFGYRIDAPGKVIVISGDTRPSPALAAAARGADILIQEVYPESDAVAEQRPGGASWPEYLRTFHTSDVEVGRIARDAHVKMLILVHVVGRAVTDSELIAGVRRGGFAGRVVVGRDLARY